MCNHSQLLPALLCALLFACNSTSKLAHKEYVPYKSDVSWQCPEFRQSFYYQNYLLNSSPKVMGILEETYSKYTCEEWEEYNAEIERKVMARQAELEAEIKAKRKLLKPYNGDVIQCRKNYDSSLTCDDYPFYSTYKPSIP